MSRSLTQLGGSLLILAQIALSGCKGPQTTFYAFADLPYSSSEVEKLRLGIQVINLDGSHTFSVHLGDIKAGKAPCERLYYEQASMLLKSLDKTTFIIPGDNEWNDCVEPDSAWALWEEHFMGFEDNWAAPPFRVDHQPARNENFAFVYRKCLYIGLNLVGGRVHDVAEWEKRLADNARWLAQQFAANRKKVKCAVVFGHAQPASGSPGPNQAFFDALRAAALDLDKPVLFMHGDGHVLELERFLVDNLLRFELNGGKEKDWLMKVVVSPGRKQPFAFQLPAPLITNTNNL
ncbi:MAG: hypothetical protein KDD19_18245 [Phaeodactylibacter sp.]|nr:hypothetical protein [Phaeodactylibacter sp.]